MYTDPSILVIFPSTVVKAGPGAVSICANWALINGALSSSASAVPNHPAIPVIRTTTIIRFTPLIFIDSLLGNQLGGPERLLYLLGSSWPRPPVQQSLCRDPAWSGFGRKWRN